MKKYELLRINDLLVKSVNYQNHEFAYAIFKNKQIVENALIEVDFMNDVSPEYVEYENKRVDLCKRTCKKDSSGKDVVKDGRFEIEDTETFNKVMIELREMYKIYIDKRDEQINQFNIIMQQNIELQFVMVEKKDLPVEIKTATEMFEYGFMIK